MDHEEESEMAETTSKEGSIVKHAVNRRDEEARADDEYTIGT